MEIDLGGAWMLFVLSVCLGKVVWDVSKHVQSLRRRRRDKASATQS